MGIFSDHWQSQAEEINIDVEVYIAGFSTAGCALFVNDERVDSVQSFSAFITRLSLRHTAKIKNRSYSIVVLIKQNVFGTKASLRINGVDSPLTRIP